MTKAMKGNKVTVKYKGKLKNGSVFDEGEFDFVLGAGKVIRGFDDAVMGMETGQTKQVEIKAKDAYGEKPGGHPLAGKDLFFTITLRKIG
ncbi:MAG: FKBP-type peptidyl-prolyl cis-trans isomerase [Candidatus Aenigmarchaeota archaeon]|nr:FKBP-type peptidyl-prolyl cis-trans isomerase [Candidatus Aenigmarchaeota archaeon]